MTAQSKPYGIVDLLLQSGFNVKSRYKLVRHREKGIEMADYRARGWLDAYQSFQPRPVFHGLDHIVVFLGLEGSLARLSAIYRILGWRPGSQGVLPAGCPFEEWKKLPYYYELERERGYEELEDNVIIDWGPGARSWHQWPTNKQIIYP